MIYFKGYDEHYEALETVITKYHERLVTHDVKVDLMVVFDEIDAYGEPSGACLKFHGTPAYAIVKIVAQEFRARGLGDCTITIDGDRWNLVEPQTQLALLDHELTHVDLVFKDNVLVRDQLERPKLRLRHHDFTHGWFTEVVERHGKFSIEHIQAQEFIKSSGQTYLVGLN